MKTKINDKFKYSGKKKIVDVVFISPGPFSRGGISKVIENLQYSNFLKRSLCIHFGTTRDYLPFLLKLPYFLSRFLLFFNFLISHKIKLISVHASSGSSFYRKVGYILLSRMFKVPIFLHIHPSHFYDFYLSCGYLTRKVVCFAFNISTGVIFLTQDMARKFSEIYPKNKIHVLANPVHVELFQSVERFNMKGNHTLLFLGWIIPGKGVYDIVDIIPEVVNDFPDVKFLFAGNKEIDKLKSLIQDRGLKPHAKVLGWVEGETKIQLLRSSRLLLLPTYTEGIPNVLLEAMACGLPAITTPVGGIPSFFQEGVNGYYVRPGDKEGLRNLISSLLYDDDECTRLSVATSRSASERFDVNIIGRELEQIYRPYLLG